ncbi:MFS transporter [Paucibacter sp. Y2R2-4]|uniref:MFS transporter n=1 Tax=Paucibacter sp. Y2R2-4 TaxID=2893553 RepID=UPI0021E48E0D|nr:MFS transporter [Paucibacter sp. Y2R2-4]MCV2351298.1 MFS transporter [Paucibacter sp. Y2R2-4]
MKGPESWAMPGNAASARYGALGFALAFVALPLYISLPAHYAQEFGMPLAQLGALLLGARLFDALLDPWIGRLCDRWLNQHPARVLPLMRAAALLLAGGFAAVFFPPWRTPNSLLLWCVAALLLTYFGYSLLSVMHQTWGARFGGSAVQQSRVVAWREGFALVGVITASLLPGWIGLAGTALTLALALGLGLLLLGLAPRAPAVAMPIASKAPAVSVWRRQDFRRLMAVFLCNGIATAIPASLLLFFVRDRLQTPQWEGAYLASYFCAAALSLPLWLRMVKRWGHARSWLAAMVLAVASFVWAAMLGEGDSLAFTAVCIASGLAMGADLAIPSALLARLVHGAGLGGQAEGAFFGWWNAANKLNLALAAGLSLPMLQALGYAPGLRDVNALQALTVAYCLLPCLLKLLAAGLLYQFWIRTALNKELP